MSRPAKLCSAKGCLKKARPGQRYCPHHHAAASRAYRARVKARQSP